MEENSFPQALLRRFSLCVSVKVIRLVSERLNETVVWEEYDCKLVKSSPLGYREPTLTEHP
jgi:hypothetical protein